MEKYRKESEQTFDTFCGLLDHIGWKYRADRNSLGISTGASGEDLPMEIVLRFNPAIGRFFLMSQMPVTMKEEKRIDAALVVNEFNKDKKLGAFDLDFESGRIFFKVTQCFVGCRVSEELCSFLLQFSLKFIDDYNDKFLMLNNGLISTEQFLAAVKS